VIKVDHLLLPGDPPPVAGAPARACREPDHSLREAVHRHIRSVLEAVGGNKRRAAR
jgi:hypothetical protein